MNATARAQAVETLDKTARTLKRQIREKRELLGEVRRAQAALTGIAVEDYPQPKEAQDGNHPQGPARG